MNKKTPAHFKTNPAVSVVAVESGHELGINQSFSQPFALLLSNRELCIHKQKLDMAFISERHFVKAAQSKR